MSTQEPERSHGPLKAGDVTQIEDGTVKRWGQVRLKSPAGLRVGPITAEVFMTDDRSRFRVIDTGGKTEILSSLQFCKFILELRATGRFDFERGPPSRRAALLAAPPPAEREDAPPKPSSLSRRRSA